MKKRELSNNIYNMNRTILALIAAILISNQLYCADIVAAEYFFDTDPGQGSGTVIPVTSGANQSIDINIPPGVIAALPEGAHKLYLRFQDDDGDWSMANYRTIFRELSIILLRIIHKVSQSGPLTLSIILHGRKLPTCKKVDNYQEI